MGLLDNKRALIVGVASNRSIAWGIAQAMHREGAELLEGYRVVITGTMRLTPSSTAFWMVCTKTFRVCDTLIRRCTCFAILQTLLHCAVVVSPTLVPPIRSKHSARCLEWLCFADLCMVRITIDLPVAV